MILNLLHPWPASPRSSAPSLVPSGWIGRIAPRLSFLTAGRSGRVRWRCVIWLLRRGWV